MHLKTVGTTAIQNNFIDPETGEYLDQEMHVKQHKILVNDEFEFYMVSLQAIGITHKLDLVSQNVLAYALTHCQFNTNLISLTKPCLEDMEKYLNYKVQTLRDAICRLKKAKVIIGRGSGIYRVNPIYFWKGKTSEHKKTIKYVLEVECPEC